MMKNNSSQYIGKKLIAIDECRISATRTLTLEGGAEIDVWSGSCPEYARDRAEGDAIGAVLVRIERRLDALGRSCWFFIFEGGEE